MRYKSSGPAKIRSKQTAALGGAIMRLRPLNGGTRGAKMSYYRERVNRSK